MTLRKILFSLGTGCLLLLVMAGPASSQVATLLAKEGEQLPGAAAGQLVTGFNSTAVNHADGYAFTVTTSDGTTTLSHSWGAAAGGPGTVLFTEGTHGIFQETSWESFFGISNSGQTAYSPICNNLDSGSTGLDAVFVDGTYVMAEEEPYPHMAGWYWRFGSRPGITADGNPYFVGGITDTQGGATMNRGLFYGFGTTPLLLGGDFIGGLPDPVDMGTTISFDYRVSRLGSHWIGEVTTETGSTTNDNHMVIDGNVIMLDGLPVSEAGPIPASAGGLPGENWDNFDSAGITEDLHYMFTGDTDGSTATDEFVLVDGVIAYREGDVVDGETLAGSIEGAYLNENGDVVYVWDIQGGVLEAMYANNKLLLKEGDAVDVDGDLVPDPGNVITDFTGIAAVCIGDRSGDAMTRVYFTADVDFVPPAGKNMSASAGEPAIAAQSLDSQGLSAEDFENLQDPGNPGRDVLEGAFELIVPTVVPVYLADFRAAAEAGAVVVSWTVSAGSDPALFRVVGRQNGTSWDVAYQQVQDGQFVARDERTGTGSVTYSLYRQVDGDGWSLLGNQTVQLQTPDLVTRLVKASPNPFNPQTRIEFNVSAPQHVRLVVFDMTGRMVVMLADEVFGAGTQTVQWDGRDLAGQDVASGTYVAQLEAGGKLDAQKIMLVR